MEDFELTINELRARQGTKWTKYPASVLPLWVADMDFRVAEPVQAAIRRLVDQSDYGYGARTGEASLSVTFADRMQERYGWAVNPDHVMSVSELIQSMYGTIMAFSAPGDGVVLQTPIYPPFINAVQDTGRRIVENPLVNDGARLVMDLDGLRNVIDGTTRMLLLCNPHNPAGRVFTRAELQALGDIAVERDLIIVSDEIHQDIVYSGHRHLPIASISPTIEARTITLTSATKSHNIAGLRCAVMHFGSAALRERFHAVFPDRLLGQVSTVGIDATVAAWRQGGPWLDAVLKQLETNRDRVSTFLATELPEITHHTPEGTYLAWLDCSALGLTSSPPDYFLEHAGVAFSGGTAFGERARHGARLNFATSPEVLELALAATATAVRHTRLSRV